MNQELESDSGLINIKLNEETVYVKQLSKAEKIIDKINNADEIEILEFDFDECFDYMRELELKLKNKTQTENIPTENGYYWLIRKGFTNTIVSICDIEEGLIEYGAMAYWSGTDEGSSLCEVINNSDCKWIGPLAPYINK